MTREELRSLAEKVSNSIGRPQTREIIAKYVSPDSFPRLINVLPNNFDELEAELRRAWANEGGAD